MTKEQLIALLNDMSLEEKVNQMSQVIGGFFDDDTVITGPMAEMGFTEENIELSGSVIGSMGAETVKKIQKSYMEKHPHHIPLLFMLDIINGYKTVFPIPLGQGATFEPELCAERVCLFSSSTFKEMLAVLLLREMVRSNITLMSAPVLFSVHTPPV